MVTGTVLRGVGQEVKEEEAFGSVVKEWGRGGGGWQVPAGIVTPGGEKEGNRGMEYSGF